MNSSPPISPGVSRDLYDRGVFDNAHTESYLAASQSVKKLKKYQRKRPEPLQKTPQALHFSPMVKQSVPAEVNRLVSTMLWESPDTVAATVEPSPGQCEEFSLFDTMTLEMAVAKCEIGCNRKISVKKPKKISQSALGSSRRGGEGDGDEYGIEAQAQQYLQSRTTSIGEGEELEEIP